MIDYPPPLDWFDIIDEQQWRAWLDHAASHNRWAVTAFVVSQWAPWAYAQGRDDLVRRWLYQLPPSALTARLYCVRGWSALHTNDTGTAMVQLDQARAVQQAGDKLAVALFASACARRRGDVADALYISQALLIQAQTTQDQAFAVGTIIGPPAIGVVDRGLDDACDAQPLPDEQGDSVACALLEHDLAVSYEHHGDLESAATHLKRSVAYWHSVHADPRSADDPWLLLGLLVPRCRALLHYGRVQRLLGQFGEANQQHARALGAAWEVCAVAIVAQEPKSRNATFWARVQTVVVQLSSDAARNTVLAAQLSAPAENPLLWDAHTALVDVLAEGALLHSARDEYMLAMTQLQLAQEVLGDRPQPRVALAHARCALAQAQWHAAASWVALVTQSEDRELELERTLVAGQIACGQGQRALAQQHIQQAVLLLTPATPGLLYLQTLLLKAAAARCVRPHQLSSFKQAIAAAHVWGQNHNADLLVTTLVAALHKPRSAPMSARDGSADEANAPASNAVLQVVTLGRDAVYWNGAETSFGWRQAREVLIYLLEHSNGAATTEIGAAVWPHLDADAQVAAVKNAVRTVRKHIPDLIRTVAKGYQVQRDNLEISYDAQRLRQAVETDEPDALEVVYTEYAGLFLPHSTNPWCLGVRAELERAYTYTLTLLAHKAEERRDWHAALQWWQRVLDREKAHEMAHTGRMR